jgi:NAD(P)-dependent dehydrogenase (short-subunit alcohol dehydrogenase family)
MQADMTGKVVLITGANSGIGKEAAVALARFGATVIVGARNEQRGRKALNEIKRRSRVVDDRVTLLPLDLAKFRSIRTAAATVLERHERLDVLVNNAGGIISDRRVTEDGFEMMFGVNHLGHFLLTELLMDRLVATAGRAGEARIVNVSSIAHHLAGGMTFSDLQHERLFNGTMVYNETKLANVLFTMELARRLEGTGVVANCLHPGAVRSGFGAAGDTRGIEHLVLLLGKPFMVSSHRGAQPIVRLAALPKFATATGGYYVGGYLSRCAKHPASAAGRDPAAAHRLWQMSEALVAGVPTMSEAQDAG